MRTTLCSSFFFFNQTSNILFASPLLSMNISRKQKSRVYSERITILNIQNLIPHLFIHRYPQKEQVEQLHVPKNTWIFFFFFHVCPHFCHHFYKCRLHGASRQSLFPLPACIHSQTISALHTGTHIKSQEEEDVLLLKKDARDLSFFLHSSHTEAWLTIVKS